MGKLSKKDIIGRWQTPEGEKKREQVIKSLMNNEPIDRLPFIERIDGYYDLRGVFFDNKTNLKNVEIKDMDFSYSKLNCLVLEGARIENVIFEMCDCTEMLQYGCHFENCKFIKSKFPNAGFGIDGGKYINIVFEDSNLKGAMFFYPDFNECTFKNCKLEGVDFSASHFENVKFIGKLEDVWFRGESPKHDDQRKQLNKVRGINPMIVDFSDADLWFITYSDNCDLSKAIMPKDGNHYLIHNFKNVLRHLEDDVENTVDKRVWKFVKEFIEMYKYHIVKQDMVILNIRNVIANAEYYLGKDSKSYCQDFIEKLIKLSNS